MKPVLREVVDKNGNTEMVFTPTARMVLYSIHKGRFPGLSDSEVCDKAGLDRELPARWEKKYGSYFTDWLTEAVDMDSGDDAAVLERVGMMQAAQPGNFQYWREMARTKGVIKDEQPKKGITLNTDFTVVLQNFGGDLAAAKDQLLRAARGLGESGGAGVVESHRLDHQPHEPQGAGNRAGAMQGRPVALADSLGADRGRAEQREPVPAVPQRPAFASTYVVLDEGEIPAGAEVAPDDGDLAL